MARTVNKLNTLTVGRTTSPGKYGDGDGLYLVVDPGGARRWAMMFRHNNKQREMGLGSASVVSLADARRTLRNMVSKARKAKPAIEIEDTETGNRLL